jgi:hypothetical protein
MERNAYDEAEHWEEELDNKENIRRTGAEHKRVDGPVCIIRRFLFSR